eukprot:1108478-Pyramimonas_sp.AAC.1
MPRPTEIDLKLTQIGPNRLNRDTHLALCPCPISHYIQAPRRGEQWEKVGNWTQGEKRERETRGVECTLVVIGTGGPRDMTLSATRL